SIVEKRFKGFFKYRYYGIIASIILFFIVNYEETINKTDFPVGFLIAGILFISLYSLGYLFRSLSQTYRVIGEAKFNNDSIELNFLEIKKQLLMILKKLKLT
ncbi:MAG: hypothetical protein ACK46Y_15040, partial [Fluviicola sp.]